MVALLNMPRAVWKRQPQVPCRINHALNLGIELLFTPSQPGPYTLRANTLLKSDSVGIGCSTATYSGTGGVVVKNLTAQAINWPGVTCFAYIRSVGDKSLYEYPAIVAQPAVDEGYYGFWNLQCENIPDYYAFRAGDSPTNLPLNMASSAGQLITLAGTWDKSTISIYQDGILGNQASHTLAWSATTTVEHRIGNYYRYGERSFVQPIFMVAVANRAWSPEVIAEIHKNPWQLFIQSPSRFYWMPSSGAVTYSLTSALTSASTSSASALNVLRAIQTALNSASSTGDITLNVAALINLLSAVVSASSTSSSAAAIQRLLSGALTSSSDTSTALAAVLRDVITAAVSASSTASSAVQVQRTLTSALNSTSETETITLSIAGLIALLSALSSSSSTATSAVSIQRALDSTLSSSSLTGSITLNTTTLIALISAVASGSLSADSALNIARALSSAVGSVSSTADATLPIQRPLVTATTSQSSTSISAVELINLIALASTVSSQSSTATSAATISRALISNLLSASTTSAMPLSVLRDLASAIVSTSLSDAIDLHLAMLGQVDLVSMIQSGSLTNPQVRLLADLVAAIQTEMKLQMTGVSPSFTMTGSGPSIAVNRI